jgi:hypothetical protein
MNTDLFQGNSPDATDTMTKVERGELAKLVRMRAKVARTHVDQRVTELRADVEAQLSAEFNLTDEAWADATAAAQRAVEDAGRVVADICRERGIADEFAPRLHVGWLSRGENAYAVRRAELRRAAQARIDDQAKAAKVAIEVSALDVQTELLAGGLSTTAAKAFLDAMPTVTALMPTIDMKQIGAAQ